MLQITCNGLLRLLLCFHFLMRLFVNLLVNHLKPLEPLEKKIGFRAQLSLCARKAPYSKSTQELFQPHCFIRLIHIRQNRYTSVLFNTTRQTLRNGPKLRGMISQFLFSVTCVTTTLCATHLAGGSIFVHFMYAAGMDHARPCKKAVHDVGVIARWLIQQDTGRNGGRV